MAAFSTAVRNCFFCCRTCLKCASLRLCNVRNIFKIQFAIRPFYSHKSKWFTFGFRAGFEDGNSQITILQNTFTTVVEHRPRLVEGFTCLVVLFKCHLCWRAVQLRHPRCWRLRIVSTTGFSL